MEMVDTSRVRFFRWAMMAIFFVLIVRIFQLQILQSSVYKRLSERNRIRRIPVIPPRGIIFDRNGRVVVENRPSYSLFVIPREFREAKITPERLSSLLGISKKEIEERIERAGGGLFTPVRIRRDINFLALSNLEENKLDLPGIYYQAEPVRVYPSPVSLSHLIGYTGEADMRDLERVSTPYIDRGDIVGKSGVEKSYDHVLRGRKGYRYLEIDVLGRVVGNFNGKRDVDPVPGKNIMLTIDVEFQRRVENLMKDVKGAAVVLDPRNGEILAMVSMPDFPLELFVKGLSVDLWTRLKNDPDKPLINRAIQAQLPPGSVFKLILAAAALEEGIIDQRREIFCNGYFWFGDRLFHCWRSDGHGSVNMIEALGVSCNIYFFNLGLMIGLDNIIRYGRMLCIGDLTGIDLPDENRGLLPQKRYLNRKYGQEGLSEGMVLNLSVGQGDLLVTPIQMANLASIIALEGEIQSIHVVKSIFNDHVGKWEEAEQRARAVKKIYRESFRIIKEGMYRAVNCGDGTAIAASVDGLDICGKTGTAQNPYGKPHAWFIGFAPLDRPELVVVVVVENGGSGGIVAAPIARGIFKYYFFRGGLE